MADTSFKAKPGSAGETYINVNETVTATPFASGATVTHWRPLPQSDINVQGRTNRYFYRDAVVAFPSATTPTFTGTVTARVVKRTAAGGVVNLSGLANITTGQAQFSTLRFPPLATVTDGQRTVEENEWIGVQIVNSGGSVSQQPGAVMFDIRLAILRG